MFYLYVLYSSSADKYYVGYSRDFRKRLDQHNDTLLKTDTFTHKNGPWVLTAAFECGENESTAIRVERFIKKQKSRKLIERIVSGEPLYGVLGDLVRVQF